MWEFLSLEYVFVWSVYIHRRGGVEWFYNSVPIFGRIKNGVVLTALRRS